MICVSDIVDFWCLDQGDEIASVHPIIINLPQHREHHIHVFHVRGADLRHSDEVFHSLCFCTRATTSAQNLFDHIDTEDVSRIL